MSDIPSNLFASRGGAYTKTVAWSHYNDPIVASNGNPVGNSRIWGDASDATQTAAINALIHEAAGQNLTVDDTALLLAIVRAESGFNPDAAAGTTSASGLGQFINATGAIYGLTSANRWDLSAQADAAVKYFVASKNAATKAGLDSSHIYAFWHDGLHSGGNGTGVPISQQLVIPNISAYKTYLESGNFGLAAASGNGTVAQASTGLEGKTPVERARHYAAQARANAARNPVPAYMKLYDMLMNLSPQLPSVAPIPGRAGQRKTALPARTGTGDAAGSLESPRPGGAALTGFRKTIADAHAQAAHAKAQREAGRAAMGLPSQSVDLSSLSFAPIPRNGATNNVPRGGTPGVNWQQDQPAAGVVGQGGESILPASSVQLSPNTAANALSPRPQPTHGGNAHSFLHEVEHVSGSSHHGFAVPPGVRGRAKTG